MIWAALAVAVLCVWYRLRRIVREIRRLSLVHHEAANRAMARHRRDRWRWRETDACLRDLALSVDPMLDIPDLEAGPPEDPDSG